VLGPSIPGAKSHGATSSHRTSAYGWPSVAEAAKPARVRLAGPFGGGRAAVGAHNGPRRVRSLPLTVMRFWRRGSWRDCGALVWAIALRGQRNSSIGVLVDESRRGCTRRCGELRGIGRDELTRKKRSVGVDPPARLRGTHPQNVTVHYCGAIGFLRALWWRKPGGHT